MLKHLLMNNVIYIWFWIYCKKSPHGIYCDNDWNLCWLSGKCQGKVREFFSAKPVATLLMPDISKFKDCYVRSWLMSGTGTWSSNRLWIKSGLFDKVRANRKGRFTTKWILIPGITLKALALSPVIAHTNACLVGIFFLSQSTNHLELN